MKRMVRRAAVEFLRRPPTQNTTGHGTPPEGAGEEG